MSESKPTPEQAKQALVDALADVRKHANAARNKAKEIIYACEEVIRAIPSGVIVDNLDLAVVGWTLSVARGALLDSSDTNGLKQAIGQIENQLFEADAYHAYLVAGDFSDQDI